MWVQGLPRLPPLLQRLTGGDGPGQDDLQVQGAGSFIKGDAPAEGPAPVEEGIAWGGGQQPERTVVADHAGQRGLGTKWEWSGLCDQDGGWQAGWWHSRS